jgi:hypothetical protein
MVLSIPVEKHMPLQSNMKQAAGTMQNINTFSPHSFVGGFCLQDVGA